MPRYEGKVTFDYQLDVDNYEDLMDYFYDVINVFRKLDLDDYTAEEVDIDEIRSDL